MKMASLNPRRASTFSASSTGRPALLVMLCLLLSMFSTPTAHMQTGSDIVVTTFDDEADSEGDCSLREAIEAANTNTAVDACPAGTAEAGSIDSIILAAGTYRLQQAGASEDNNQSGDLDVLSSMRFVGQGAGQTIIDASQLDRVFDILDNNYPSVSVEISGVTIRNGTTPTYDCGDNPFLCVEMMGGGIRNTGQLTLQDTAVISNTAGYGGGGIVDVGNLTARNSRIDRNTTFADPQDPNAGLGGGILAIGSTVLLQNSSTSSNTGNGLTSSNGSQVTLQNCRVNDNQSYSGGGGITNFEGRLLVEQGSSISGNTAPLDGGGIANLGLQQIAQATIRDSSISNNTASEGGGGVLNSFNSILAVQNSTISGNSASGAINVEDPSQGGGGGGIGNVGLASIEGSTIISNTSVGGAGIANVPAFLPDMVGAVPVVLLLPNGTMEIRESTINDNHASSFGGGILNGGSLMMDTGSISGNSAQEAGGIGNDPTGTMTMTNVLVEENSAKSASQQTGVVGGGIRNYGNLQIASSSISRNTALSESIENYGGGIINLGRLEIIDNSQVHDNASKAGGGIYNTLTGTLTLRTSTVMSNSAVYNGGGIANNGTATVVDAIISENQVSGLDGQGEGGGIINRTREGTDETSIEISDSTIADNVASFGGGIINAAQMTITRTQVRQNRAEHLGGGILNFGDRENNIVATTLNLVESTISDNRAGIDGGGLYNAGLAFLTDNTLADNTAERNGGGILNTGGLGIRNTMLRGNRALGERGGGIESFGGTQSSSAIVMLNSTLLNNSASVLGGGLSSNSDTRLINVTISNNEAGQTGAGINVESSGLITATNVTISQNNVISATGTGAGIRSGGLTLLDNSIVAQNATNGTGAACTGGMGNLTSRGHNLTDDESCAFNEPTDLAADDARLAELGDNGGATPTHALLADSPAIDSGSPATCPAIDQRGFVRPTDGNEDGSAVCDIGAYEAAARSLPSVVIDDEGGSAQVPDSDLEIGFPDGAVNVSLTINYTELITATYPLTDEVYWLRGFVLQGFNETLQTVTTLSQPINITLDYAAVEQPAVFSANELAIVLWDSEQGQWVPVQPSAACATCSVRIDTEAQQVTIVTDHLGEFALLHPQQIATDPTDPTDPEPLSVYLPLVQRS